MERSEGLEKSRPYEMYCSFCGNTTTFPKISMLDVYKSAINKSPIMGLDCKFCGATYALLPGYNSRTEKVTSELKLLSAGPNRT